MLLETQRSILEELDTIELAIAQRLHRNNVLEDAETNKKRSYKETLAQQHELKFFQEKYKRHCSKFEDIKANLRSVLTDELDGIRSHGQDFQNFDRLLQGIQASHNEREDVRGAQNLKDIYSMYSSSPKQELVIIKSKEKAKRKYILSSAAAHIDLDKIFSSNENYGKCLDLRQFYETFKSISKAQDTYVTYLGMFFKFPYEGLNCSSSSYKKYIKELSYYLLDFIKRTYPLIEEDKFETEIEDTYSNRIRAIRSDSSNGDSAGIYCDICQKHFSKQTVYDSHLKGKKHLKAMKNQETKDVKKEQEKEEVIYAESAIQIYAAYLKTKLSNTIRNEQRLSSLTDREKMLENLALTGEESEFTSISSSSSEENDTSDDDSEVKNLPLGVDGRPIPFWLYKLQGLHKAYNCEICGNMTYKGKASFGKHFSGAKHQHGLKCLGVDEEAFPLFKDITNIEEAQELWRKMKREKRLEEVDTENAVEVEDNQGNVLSEKDYLDLKKQGLL